MHNARKVITAGSSPLVRGQLRPYFIAGMTRHTCKQLGMLAQSLGIAPFFHISNRLASLLHF